MRNLLEELWAAAELLPEEEELEASPPRSAAPVPRRMRRKKAGGETAAEQVPSPASGIGEMFAAGRRWEEDEAGPPPEAVFLPDGEVLWPDSMLEEDEAGVGVGWRRPIFGGQGGTAGKKAGERFGEAKETAADRPAAPPDQSGQGDTPFLQEQVRRLRAAAELSRALGGRWQGDINAGEGAGGLSELLLPRGNGTGTARPAQSAREVDRLFQRDARRYDGAFFLY